MATVQRINRELKIFNKDPPANRGAGPIDDDIYFIGKHTVLGPHGSVYEGGIFRLRYNISKRDILLNHQR